MWIQLAVFAVWIGLAWSAFMVVAHNLHNMHQRQDGVYTTEPKFPHIWFALFLLCLTSLMAWYNFWG